MDGRLKYVLQDRQTLAERTPAATYIRYRHRCTKPKTLMTNGYFCHACFPGSALSLGFTCVFRISYLSVDLESPRDMRCRAEWALIICLRLALGVCARGRRARYVGWARGVALAAPGPLRRAAAGRLAQDRRRFSGRSSWYPGHQASGSLMRRKGWICIRQLSNPGCPTKTAPTPNALHSPPTCPTTTPSPRPRPSPATSRPVRPSTASSAAAHPPSPAPPRTTLPTAVPRPSAPARQSTASPAGTASSSATGASCCSRQRRPSLTTRSNRPCSSCVLRGMRSVCLSTAHLTFRF